LALTTHVGYDGSMFNFGIEFIAEKSLFLASAIDTYFYKYINFEHYNYIVCAGEYQRKQFQSYITSSKLLVMGSPRFDNYKDDREAAERIIEHQTGIGIPRNKKNILWLPVHGKATTCIIFAPMLAKIQNEFNIILKPHPFIYYEIPNFENRIRSIIPEIIIIRNEDYINLFPAADFVICDYGGPVFSVIKADKNVLLFNIHKSELLGMTPDLPANVIRDRIINFYPEEEEKFFAALKDDDIWEKQKKIRRQIRAEFFTENPNSARDIADLCRRIVRGEA
jgi:CDP-glycerol glycerophosphotransferase (TagB/SpsB family)